MKDVTEVQVVNTADAELCYAKNMIKKRTEDKIKEGWRTFGEVTAIYDKEMDKYMLIQVIVR